MFRFCCVICGGDPDQQEVTNDNEPLPSVKEVESEDPIFDPSEGTSLEKKEFDLEAFMSKLENGIKMIKFDRDLHNKQEREIYTPDRTVLAWRPLVSRSGKRGSEKSFKIKDIKAFRTSETQKPQSLGSVARCNADPLTAFQLALPGARNIDLQANSIEEMNEFITGLKLRIAQL